MITLIKLPTKEILNHPEVNKKLISAHRYLGELKGFVQTIPNEKILLSNLVLYEAKNSSEIENIITTQDSIYKHQLQIGHENTSNKEVHNYASALKQNSNKVKQDKGISINTIIGIQKIIEPNRPDFRKIPGTIIKNTLTNKVIYTPPSPEQIPHLMSQLEDFINTNSIDPLIKMCIIHHWFESIHPFYDGNGRTGRILNILYLLLEDLLNSPVLYLSRYILRNRAEYYHLLQKVREEENWIDWIIYMLEGVSIISQETTQLVQNIGNLFKKYKIVIREKHSFYSHDLINSIFFSPYTTVQFLMKDMNIPYTTASRYLNLLTKDNILDKHKLGKHNYYVNTQLFNLLKST